MQNLETVKVVSNRAEAGLAQSKLKANGIFSIIFADDAGGMLPVLSGGVQLKVNKKDLTKAKKILENK